MQMPSMWWKLLGILFLLNAVIASTISTVETTQSAEQSTSLQHCEEEHMAVATRRFKPIFVSHGSPTLVIDKNAQSAHLKALGKQIGKPKSIVVVSAHWEAKPIEVSISTKIIYDFYGFQDEMYMQTYNAPEAPQLAQRVVDLLQAKNIKARINQKRGLDHGAWVPLKLMYPEEDVPVVQVSLQAGLDPSTHIAMGEALRPLLDDEILVMGSGSSTHNLRMLWAGGSTEKWVYDFENWLKETIEMEDLEKRRERLINWASAPGARKSHPREEHLIPIHVIAGLAGVGKQTFSTEVFPNFVQSFYTFEFPPESK